MDTRLRQARRAKRKTLTDVAVAVGTDPGNLSKIERGLQRPGFDLAKRLHNFYGRRIPLLAILDPSSGGDSHAA